MFYVAHRLFAAHDRALGAIIAQELGAAVGMNEVFLPFCDTDEENLTAEVKGRWLFKLDRERLARLDGMLAVLHGPSLDDGVCMEIGYAAGLSVPIVVLTTDFQTYGASERGARLRFPDALVETVVTEIVRIDHLAVLVNKGNRTGPETPCGAAVMIGGAAALARRIIAWHPRPSWTFARGREPNWRNLMIQYSVHARVSDARSLEALL